MKFKETMKWSDQIGYEECRLPKEESTEQQNMPLQAVSTRRTLLHCQAAHFDSLHNATLANMYNSVDPLVRPDEGIWGLEACGAMVLVLKLFRLLGAPTADFVKEVSRDAKQWEPELHLLLVEWDWWTLPVQLATSWIPQLLRHLSWRSAVLDTSVTSSVKPADDSNCNLDFRSLSLPLQSRSTSVCSLLLAGRILQEVEQSAGDPLLKVRAAMAATEQSTDFEYASLGDILVGGSMLWAELDAWARKQGAKPLPMKVRHSQLAGAIGKVTFANYEDSAMGRYFYRLAMLPQ